MRTKIDKLLTKIGTGIFFLSTAATLTTLYTHQYQYLFIILCFVILGLGIFLFGVTVETRHPGRIGGGLLLTGIVAGVIHFLYMVIPFATTKQIDFLLLVTLSLLVAGALTIYAGIRMDKS